MTQTPRSVMICFPVENCGMTCQVTGLLEVLELTPSEENIKAVMWSGELTPN